MSIFKRFFEKKPNDDIPTEITPEPEPAAEPPAPPPRILEITPAELPQLQADGAVVIDLRFDWAYQSGHIPDAISLSIMELTFRMDEIPRGKPLVLQCYHGIDSLGVAAYLIEHGWDVTQVYSLEGGIAGWVETHGMAALEKEA